MSQIEELESADTAGRTWNINQQSINQSLTIYVDRLI